MFKIASRSEIKSFFYKTTGAGYFYLGVYMHKELNSLSYVVKSFGIMCMETCWKIYYKTMFCQISNVFLFGTQNQKDGNLFVQYNHSQSNRRSTKRDVSNLQPT